MDKKKLELADDIISAILSASAFDAFMDEDAEVSEAEGRITKAMDAACGSVSTEAAEELREAMAAIRAAYSKAGTLYGIYVAETLREAAAHPGELSSYVKDRIQKARAGE